MVRNSALFLPLLLSAVTAFTEKDMDDAERRMHELLNGEASIARYVVGLLVLVIGFCFVCGSLIWCCQVLFGCCSFTKSCFSCLFGLCRSKKKQKDDNLQCFGQYMPASGKYNKGRGLCVKKPAEITNAGGNRVLVPFCPDHVGELQEALFEPGAPFENKGRARHSINFFFGRAGDPDYDPRIDLPEEIKKAKDRVRRQGFIYIFRSKEDMKLVKYPGDKQPYFFKIGKTELPSAAERVRQWEDSNFGNVENVDYWRVDSATNAETLIHLLCGKARIRRFDRIDQAFEIEWFFDTREHLTKSMQAVVDADRKNNYDSLRSEK